MDEGTRTGRIAWCSIQLKGLLPEREVTKCTDEGLEEKMREVILQESESSSTLSPSSLSNYTVSLGEF